MDGQCILIFKVMILKEQDKTEMDRAVQCVGQWDRKAAGRRQNDTERTGRKRRKESLEKWSQEYFFVVVLYP